MIRRVSDTGCMARRVKLLRVLLLRASLTPSPAPAAPNKAVINPRLLLLQHHHSHPQASQLSNPHQHSYITAKMVKAGESPPSRHSPRIARCHFGPRWGNHCARLSTLCPRRPRCGPRTACQWPNPAVSTLSEDPDGAPLPCAAPVSCHRPHTLMAPSTVPGLAHAGSG